MQQTAKLQELTQNRLSTGLRVNSAIDNPSSYYTAAALNNRASDLSALLDAISAGIQTLKAAQQGLQTASTFLEQAASIANQALETEPIPAKEWFEQQNNVAAVATNETELLNAVNSGRKGEIVIYGKIDMTQSLSLKEGQNLVGVGYYGNFDTEVNKFSELNFDMEKHGLVTGIQVNFANTILAGLSIKAEASSAQSCNVLYLRTQNNIIQNLDLQFDCSNQPPYSSPGLKITSAILGGGFEAKGVNNINMYAKTHDTQYCIGVNSKIFMSSLSKLNISGNTKNFRGVSASTVELDGNAELSIDGALGLENCTTVQNNESIININTKQAGFYVGSYTSNGNSRLNIKASIAFQANPIYSTSINISSATALINTQATSLFYSGSENILSLNMVAGAKINYNNTVYEAEMPISRYLLVRENIPAELVDKGTAKFELPDLSALADKYASKEDENSHARQYNELLTQLNGVIKDSSYQGVNLLQNNSLSVNFNEDRSSKLEIKGIDTSTEKLGLKTKEWGNKGDIAQSLSEIASALKQIRSYTQEFGNYYSIVTTREDFTEKLINVLTEGADKLTLADMNEESANSLMLETRQNLAINALSLASQAGQSVLKLF